MCVGAMTGPYSFPDAHARIEFMVIGACIVELQLPGLKSLKEKRGVLKSLLARLHKEFNVTAAEVDLHDVWQATTIGVATVSTSAVHAQNLLNNLVTWIETY